MHLQRKEKEVELYTHPRSGTAIEGVRLPPGTIIRMDDKYDSSDGTWRAAELVAGGKVPVGDHVIWIRQPGPLSENARILLGYLSSRRSGAFSCIGEQRGTFYVIPSPTFNWDGRFDIESWRVRHPECVQELFDHGYMVVGEYEISHWHSDYSCTGPDTINRVYTLTERGKEEGARLQEK